MHGVDVQVFRSINGWPDTFRDFFVFFSLGIKLWWVIAVLALFVAAMLCFPRTRWPIVQALIAWPLADGLTHILKDALKWTRPCVDFTDVILRVGRLDSFGTASAHSANMAAVATVLVWRLGWWGSPWVLIAIATGFSRVYVGVHYPSQVVFGWLCGIAMATLVLKTWDYVETKRSSVRTSDETRDEASA